MTKILLVEDDKSLREIYSVRLLAEGYTLISSGDGEEALAVAIGEKPDLIVSDVMMPKISGFEMLDLLRSNDSTKNIPIIMLTALSSEKQRERGNRLGADRYLIKSQVGIEDIVRQRQRKEVGAQLVGFGATLTRDSARDVFASPVRPEDLHKFGLSWKIPWGLTAPVTAKQSPNRPKPSPRTVRPVRQKRRRAPVLIKPLLPQPQISPI